MEQQLEPTEIARTLLSDIESGKAKAQTRWQGKRVIIKTPSVIAWYRVWDGKATLAKVSTDKGETEADSALRTAMKKLVPNACIRQFSSMHDDEDCDETFSIDPMFKPDKKKKKKTTKKRKT